LLVLGFAVRGSVSFIQLHDLLPFYFNIYSFLTFYFADCRSRSVAYVVVGGLAWPASPISLFLLVHLARESDGELVLAVE